MPPCYPPRPCGVCLAGDAPPTSLVEKESLSRLLLRLRRACHIPNEATYKGVEPLIPKRTRADPMARAADREVTPKEWASYDDYSVYRDTYPDRPHPTDRIHEWTDYWWWQDNKDRLEAEAELAERYDRNIPSISVFSHQSMRPRHGGRRGGGSVGGPGGSRRRWWRGYQVSQLAKNRRRRKEE
jgi:hypothetical protein